MKPGNFASSADSGVGPRLWDGTLSALDSKTEVHTRGSPAWEYPAEAAVDLDSQVMRISFLTEAVAQAAVEMWKGQGFSASRCGTSVTTDCPTLWAVSVVDRQIGFDKVERLEVAPAGPRLSSSDPCLREAAFADGSQDEFHDTRGVAD